MNRKRIVALRSAFYSQCGALEAVPPPHSPDQVWLPKGYKWFPYFLLYMNFTVLLMVGPFTYTITDNIAYSLSAMAVVLLLVAVGYTKLCHRYAEDMWCGKAFLSQEFSAYYEIPLRDLGNPDMLRFHCRTIWNAEEWTDRKKRRGLLVVYWTITIISCVLWVAWSIVHTREVTRIVQESNELGPSFVGPPEAVSAFVLGADLLLEPKYWSLLSGQVLGLTAVLTGCAILLRTLTFEYRRRMPQLPADHAKRPLKGDRYFRIFP